jgi:hypothetical protein
MHPQAKELAEVCRKYSGDVPEKEFRTPVENHLVGLAKSLGIGSCRYFPFFRKSLMDS